MLAGICEFHPTYFLEAVIKLESNSLRRPQILIDCWNKQTMQDIVVATAEFSLEGTG